MHGHKTPRPVYIQMPKEKTFTEKEMVRLLWIANCHPKRSIQFIKSLASKFFK